MPDQPINENSTEQSVAVEPTPAQVEVIHQKILKQKSHTNGSGWFYWIAGLSLITSIVSLSGGSWTFLAGLGITQVFDGFSLGLISSGIGPWVKGLSFFLDLCVAGSFIIIGLFARKGSKAAYVTGMVLYGLDTVILLAFQQWFGLGFHAFAMVQIWVGFSALKWLNELPASVVMAPQVVEPVPRPVKIEYH